MNPAAYKRPPARRVGLEDKTDPNFVRSYRVNQTATKLNCRHWPSFACHTKFGLAFIITITIILAQLFIVHYYVNLSGGNLYKLGSYGSNLELIEQHTWLCSTIFNLGKVIKLASKYKVHLILVDPDLLRIIDATSNLADDNKFRAPISFSDITSNARIIQEPGNRKPVVHLVAVNETSGGQPNLKLFFNSLLHSGYIVSKYNDASETMQPEVYRRPVHLFDDNDGQTLTDSLTKDYKRVPAQSFDEEEEKVSKIYTEFISHLLILNTTQATLSKSSELVKPCTDSKVSEVFPVIHVMILYNYEYQPSAQWIQSELSFDEIEKHRLLSYGLHSIDFRLPLRHYHTHNKRSIKSLQEIFPTNKIFKPLNDYGILDENHLLSYANNSYAHCKRSMFNISALLDNSKRLSRYLDILDNAQPLKSSPFKDLINGQMILAFRFMSIFSDTYGGFNYWITGSTLLAYHKFCELILVPRSDGSRSLIRISKSENVLERDSVIESDNQNFNLQSLENDIVINLELGILANELNSSMLEDLTKANVIGVTMISDWRKPNGHISFHIRDCPNLIFNIYPYELRRDFYQYYYVTRNSMILNHKFRRKRSSPIVSLGEESQYSLAGEHHHAFNTRNLELCSTRLDRYHPFKVPCDAHDHLRRIYII